MINAINELITTLKLSRRNKGLSQRAFASSVGIPQSRLSRIESGNVDLRTSNLIELARTLDLEVMLIPRQLMPVINNLLRESGSLNTTTKEIPMYSLDDEEEDDI